MTSCECGWKVESNLWHMCQVLKWLEQTIKNQSYVLSIQEQ